MQHKCANPPCSTLFRKMSEGRLFQFARRADSPIHKRHSAPAFEYFWLCDRCLSTLTLAFDPGSGVRVIAATGRRRESFLVGSRGLPRLKDAIQEQV